MQIKTAALGLAFGLAVGFALTISAADTASAQTAGKPSVRVARGDAAVATRPRVRIYRAPDARGVYPSYYPGPNAVRDCTAHLVQEFRPSGTVIVPRMDCFWRRG